MFVLMVLDSGLSKLQLLLLLLRVAPLHVGWQHDAQ
jgi:hypothetical protein